jgi:hypothetical protein
MHPTSVYGAAPSLVGPQDILIYSQLLETSKTFVMNATKAHLLPTLLMCSSDIDTNRAGDRLLVDNWIEVRPLARYPYPDPAGPTSSSVSTT